MKLFVKIRALRKEAGKTQSRAAQDAGIQTAAWTCFETGSLRYRNPQLKTIQAIAKGLGCSVPFLLDGVDPVEGDER